MDRSFRLSCWLILAVASAAVCPVVAAEATAEKGSAYQAALESITNVELKGHVDYLADDRLEGRESGTRGGRAASEYLVNRLNRAPFQGTGADGGFVQPFAPNFRNVLARLPGSDPELNQQYVVLGAHYDHIGYGARGSLSGYGQIHNGADDNASGTSGLLEVADAFATLSESPRRSILLAFWDAEEKGLLGSKHWAAHPTVPREQVVAMINLDMIGRLRDRRLTVLGTRSGYGLRKLVSLENASVGLTLEFPWKMASEADHYSFFERGIPVLMFNTGLHDQYHRATDDSQWINSEGMQEVARLVFRVAHELAANPVTPAFRAPARQETQEPSDLVASQAVPIPERLGVTCQWQAATDQGVCVTSVSPGSPAQQGGLAVGDRILQFDGRTVRSSDELARAVMGAENPVPVVLQRAEQPEPVTLSVNLAGSPMRLGITWRIDEAEPGSVILTHVVSRSPAALAGLGVGDRIYQIDGHDFTTDAEFRRLAKTLPGPLRLLVERHGRIRVVELRLDPEPLDRSA